MKEQILEIYNNFVNQILLVAEASLPQSQFSAFRKFVLDRHGDATRQIKKLLDKQIKEVRSGKERV